MIAHVVRAGLLAGLATLTSGCATTSQPVPARLSAEPDAAQIKMIEATVRKAMQRDDVALEPALLAYSSTLVVRPVAVPGMTDRVPGTPVRLTLMMDGTSCWLADKDGDMRIDLPEMSCRKEGTAP